MTPNKAIKWSLFWVSLSILFAGYLSINYGSKIAVTYWTCYLVEKLLSLDNLLVFYVLFKYFDVPPYKQRIALNIGLITSFILRGLMIFSGGFLIHKFNWLSYLFGAFLVYSAGAKLLQKGEENEPKHIINFVGKWWPGMSIFGAVIVVIELFDVLFALDSIPASFGITSNPMIIYAANIFAVLGLRSLYFVMLRVIDRFAYLDKIASGILACVGIKMIVQTYMG